MSATTSTPAAVPTAALVLDITASIGATLFPQDNSDAETLLRHAGHALYSVKHTGRNGFQFFDTAQRLRDEASLIALARVQQALDDGELRLHYQPKINMQTAQVLGMEALLRWQHPERGLLAPAHFLPLIEPTSLGVRVGDWVIEQALKQSAHWLS
ncbi:EAL domain-containing protein, partial [Roseateles sp. GG27B]